MKAYECGNRWWWRCTIQRLLSSLQWEACPETEIRGLTVSAVCQVSFKLDCLPGFVLNAQLYTTHAEFPCEARQLDVVPLQQTILWQQRIRCFFPRKLKSKHYLTQGPNWQLDHYCTCNKIQLHSKHQQKFRLLTGQCAILNSLGRCTCSRASQQCLLRSQQ